VEFNKADAKFAGIIGSPFEGEWFYDALEYAPSTPYNPPLAPRKTKCRATNNTVGAVVVPTILFPTVPEEDAEEMDWEPILDEVAPPEHLSEHVQQPDEVQLPLGHADSFCYCAEDEEDDGSDFYFCLPPLAGSSTSADIYSTSMEVEVGEVADAEEVTAVMESEEEDPSVAMEDLVEEISTIVSMVPEDLAVHELAPMMLKQRLPWRIRSHYSSHCRWNVFLHPLHPLHPLLLCSVPFGYPTQSMAWSVALQGSEHVVSGYSWYGD
jgi:hypothetical protein